METVCSLANAFIFNCIYDYAFYQINNIISVSKKCSDWQFWILIKNNIERIIKKHWIYEKQRLTQPFSKILNDELSI